MCMKRAFHVMFYRVNSAFPETAVMRGIRWNQIQHVQLLARVDPTLLQNIDAALNIPLILFPLGSARPALNNVISLENAYTSTGRIIEARNIARTQVIRKLQTKEHRQFIRKVNFLN
jgi:hypothetical protein